jgi:hypothetical protein
MARVNLGDLNLTITSKSDNAVRSLAIMQQFLKTIPIIMQEFADRADAEIKQIVPQKSEEFVDKKGKSRKKNKRLGLPLRKTISVSNFSDTGFEVRAGDTGITGVKALMQEFGYPYDNWYGPYDPNPNSPIPRFKGLGYLRVGLIAIARSLDAEQTDYAVSASQSSIKNYERVVNQSLNSILQKFALRFARGELDKLPKYYRNKVKAPTETVAPNVSRFGTFKGLNLRIPLYVELNNRVVDGLQLKGIGQSKSGKSFVSPSASFLI